MACRLVRQGPMGWRPARVTVADSLATEPARPFEGTFLNGASPARPWCLKSGLRRPEVLVFCPSRDGRTMVAAPAGLPGIPVGGGVEEINGSEHRRHGRLVCTCPPARCRWPGEGCVSLVLEPP